MPRRSSACARATWPRWTPCAWRAERWFRAPGDPAPASRARFHPLDQRGDRAHAGHVVGQHFGVGDPHAETLLAERDHLEDAERVEESALDQIVLRLEPREIE